jgi:flagellum-specific ATP synthase
MERAIAERGRYPAINVLKSISRLMPMCHTTDENALIARAKTALALYGEMEELIRIGAYKPGADLEVDEAVRVRPALEALLAQERDERTSIKDGFAMLAGALA